MVQSLVRRAWRVAGRPRVTRRSMPLMAAQRANPVYAARFAHLTTRQQNKLTVTQAQAVIAAAILRQLHAVVTTGRRWDPAIATHGTRPPAVLPIAA